MVLLYAAEIVIPTVVLFEVYKKLKIKVSEEVALTAVATLSRHRIQELSLEIALEAADIAIFETLGMADSVVLAHARVSSATLVTLDNDFAGLANVQVLREVTHT